MSRHEITFYVEVDENDRDFEEAGDLVPAQIAALKMQLALLLLTNYGRREQLRARNNHPIDTVEVDGLRLMRAGQGEEWHREHPTPGVRNIPHNPGVAVNRAGWGPIYIPEAWDPASLAPPDERLAHWERELLNLPPANPFSHVEVIP